MYCMVCCNSFLFVAQLGLFKEVKIQQAKLAYWVQTAVLISSDKLHHMCNFWARGQPFPVISFKKYCKADVYGHNFSTMESYWQLIQLHAKSESPQILCIDLIAGHRILPMRISAFVYGKHRILACPTLFKYEFYIP